MKPSQMLQRIKKKKSWRSLVILTVGILLEIREALHSAPV